MQTDVVSAANVLLSAMSNWLVSQLVPALLLVAVVCFIIAGIMFYQSRSIPVKEETPPAAKKSWRSYFKWLRWFRREGEKPMSWRERRSVLNRHVADRITDVIDDMLKDGVMTHEEARLYYKRLARSFGAFDMMPKAYMGKPLSTVLKGDLRKYEIVKSINKLRNSKKPKLPDANNDNPPAEKLEKKSRMGNILQAAE